MDTQRGEDLVAHSQLLGDDPFWLTSTDFMPVDAPSVVPVPVVRVSQDSMAGGHANRHHSIRFDFDQFTRERPPAGSQDSLENPIMGQDQVALANLRDWQRSAGRRDPRIWMKTKGWRGDDASDLPFLEFLFDNPALRVRQSCIVESDSMLDAPGQTRPDRGRLFLCCRETGGHFLEVLLALLPQLAFDVRSQVLREGFR